MEQRIAVTNVRHRSLPATRARGKRSQEEENNILVKEAAHDLRTSLTIITGITYMLRRQLERDEELDRTHMEKGLEHIDVVVAQLNALFGRILDASSPESPRTLALLREPVDLAALAVEVVTEHEMLGMSHRILLDVPQPVMGPWDRSLMRRVVSNLLSNALKYSPEGSVVVAVHREDEAAESWAILSVTDHGPGIPPQDLPSIFDAFYRGQRVPASVPGTGLGLAIVRRIVDLHGGQAAITSEEGRGTSIAIRLPICHG